MTNETAKKVMGRCPYCFRALASGIPPSIIKLRLTLGWPRNKIDAKHLEQL